MFKATIDKFQTLKGKDTVSILLTAKKSEVSNIAFLEGKEVVISDGIAREAFMAEKIANTFALIQAEIADLMDECKPKEVA
jgi:hypothetical protein